MKARSSSGLGYFTGVPHWVEALLKEHMLPTPPESADKAFELLATLTFGSTSSSVTAAVKVDRQLLRLAAGVLKSPKEFLPAADKLLETFERLLRT